MKKLLIVLLVLMLSGCKSTVAFIRGYDGYIEEIDSYYHKLNEVEGYTLIKIDYERSEKTETQIGYSVGKTPVDSCTPLERLNEDGTVTIIERECFGYIMVDLYETNAYKSYFIIYEEKLYSLDDGLEISFEVYQELFSKVDGAQVLVLVLE